MNDDKCYGPDRVYTDPELLEDFLQNILWPFLEFGPNTLALLTNRSDLSDFLPDVEAQDYQRLADSINHRYGIKIQSRDCGNIADMLEFIRDDPQTKRVW